jgi:hypothetical protein
MLFSRHWNRRWRPWLAFSKDIVLGEPASYIFGVPVLSLTVRDSVDPAQ